MQRFERTERHGRYVIIASASKVHGQGPHRNEWDVLVSIADLGAGMPSKDPVLLKLDERYWSDPDAGLTHAMSFAAQKIGAGHLTAEPQH